MRVSIVSCLSMRSGKSSRGAASGCCAGCDGAGVRPLVVRARLVFPAEFNELCDHFDSKGAALSHVTIGLLREVMEGAQRESGARVRTGVPLAEASSPVFALCDKHGARNRYTALLQHHFAEHWIRNSCGNARRESLRIRADRVPHARRRSA